MVIYDTLYIPPLTLSKMYGFYVLNNMDTLIVHVHTAIRSEANMPV